VLDAKYSENLQELRLLKRDLIDSKTGQFKDNAMSFLTSLTNK
jgi:hypothetical protein